MLDCVHINFLITASNDTRKIKVNTENVAAFRKSIKKMSNDEIQEFITTINAISLIAPHADKSIKDYLKVKKQRKVIMN